MVKTAYQTSRPPPDAGTVLLIDDSQLLVDVVSKVLDDRNWSVRTALCGKDGLLAAETELPDVVVCDLHMPQMSGMEVLAALHELDAKIPVIMLSGNEEISSVLAAVRQGAFDYVTKDDDYIDALLAAVDRAYGHVNLLRENTRLSEVVRRANSELEANLAEMDRQHQQLVEAQCQSETLLRKILPGPIADRLRADEENIADGFPDVTVLFADIVGFAQFAAERSPKEVVVVLNKIFSEFDRLAIKYGVEKIKTIGDGYMAASGLPVPRTDHAEIMASFAFAMCVSIASLSTEMNIPVHLRIGMHSGPVVAGIVGESKFCYDLWGDTVNLASRMETYGKPGAIHVSEACAERLRPWCELESRGHIDLKGFGSVPTYFLRDFKEVG